MIGKAMNNEPLVSILTPCYNVEKYLPQCLDSIIYQTYKNIQIVLIDDGSKDDTWNIMQEYAAGDSRIEIYHQENQGVAATRNNLIDKVKGEYVLFVDSDDWIEFDMIEFLVGKAICNNADIAMCKLVINDTKVNQDYSEAVYDKDTTIRKFLLHKDLRGSLCIKLVKSVLLSGIQFNSNISYGEDALLCWHFFQNADIVVDSSKELYHYRMNAQSICHSIFNHKKLSGHYAWEQICNETKEWWPQYFNISQARHCVEDCLLLRDAAHSNYQNKDDIKLLQKTIRDLRHTLNDVDITSNKMKMFAFLASHSYWIASKI